MKISDWFVIDLAGLRLPVFQARVRALIARGDKVRNKTDDKRRKLIKAVGIGGGVYTALPGKWQRPVVNSVLVPAHAQTTCSPTPDDLPVSVDGELTSNVGDDVYNFNVDACQTPGDIEVAVNLGTLVDSRVRVEDQDSTQLTFDDDGAPGLASLLVVTLPAGTTGIIVRVGLIQPFGGTYTLTVTRV